MRSFETLAAELEKIAGTEFQRRTIWIISFMRAGPDGPVHYDPSGYATSLSDDRAMHWHRQPEKTIAQLQDRVDRDTPRGPGCMAVLYECHD